MDWTWIFPESERLQGHREGLPSQVFPPSWEHQPGPGIGNKHRVSTNPTLSWIPGLPKPHRLPGTPVFQQGAPSPAPVALPANPAAGQGLFINWHPKVNKEDAACFN